VPLPTSGLAIRYGWCGARRGNGGGGGVRLSKQHLLSLSDKGGEIWGGWMRVCLRVCQASVKEWGEGARGSERGSFNSPPQQFN
jgi:hypothetical protein